MRRLLPREMSAAEVAASEEKTTDAMETTGVVERIDVVDMIDEEEETTTTGERKSEEKFAVGTDMMIETDVEEIEVTLVVETVVETAIVAET